MKSLIDEHVELVKDLNAFEVEEIAAVIKDRLKKGGKVLIFGNGGSAADSQHFAAELMCKFKKPRRSLPAIALTTDTSTLTAIGNDFGFDKIFERQLEGLLRDGDTVIGISTSGNSANVVRALEFSKKFEDVYVISLTGRGPNVAQSLSDKCIAVDSLSVARIQEVHELVLHLIAESLESIDD